MGARFISWFWKVYAHYYATLFCQWHLSFLVQSVQYVVLLAFSLSFLVAHILFQPLKNQTLFSTHRYYLSSKHVRTVALHLAWPVHPLCFLPSKFISFWLLLLSINLTPHIALITNFSFLNFHLILLQAPSFAPAQHCRPYTALINPFICTKSFFRQSHFLCSLNFFDPILALAVTYTTGIQSILQVT